MAAGRFEEFEEERCNIVELKVGDIISRAIKTHRGAQIIPKNFTLTEESMGIIIENQIKNEISEIVYRKIKND